MSYEDLFLLASLLVLLMVVGYIIYVSMLKEDFTTSETVSYECVPRYSVITGVRKDMCTQIYTSPAPSVSPVVSISATSLPASTSSTPALVEPTLISPPPSPSASELRIESLPLSSSTTPYVAPAEFPTLDRCILRWNGTCLGTSQHKDLRNEGKTTFVILTTTDNKQIFLPVYIKEYVVSNINTSLRVKNSVQEITETGINLQSSTIKDIQNTKVSIPYNIQRVAVPPGYRAFVSFISVNGTSTPSLVLEGGVVSTLTTPIMVDSNVYKDVRLKMKLLL